MKKVIIIIILNLISFNMILAKDIITISQNDLVVLSNNVPVYNYSNKVAKQLITANVLDVFRIKNDKIVNNRIEVLLKDNVTGWIDVNNTSYFNYRDWKKNNEFKSVEIYVPNYTDFQSEPVEDINGKVTEYHIYNPTYFIDIARHFETNGLDVNSYQIQTNLNESGSILNYNGYSSFYEKYIDDIEGGYGYSLLIIGKDGKTIYSISITLKTNSKLEQELIAKKILFSVRLKDESTVSISNQYYLLTGDNVRVRAEAGTNSAVLASLSKGTKVKLIQRTDKALTVGDKKGFWALVETADGVKGYVFDYYLKEDKGQ